MLIHEEKYACRGGDWLTRSLVPLGVLVLFLGTPHVAAADVVTDWNQIMLTAIRSAPTSPAITPRITAIVHAAVFDAVNGIERRYTPYHVDFDAPHGASRRAAAIQAAYATLVKLFPTQKATLDARRLASLTSITDDGEFEDSQSIARGIEWGQAVADDILAWRGGDGFNVVLPPYTGGTAAGQWRPTPPAFAPANFPQISTMMPFAMTSPSQFRAAGPPVLTSEQYAADFNESKSVGPLTGSTRTDEQTLIARFWAFNAAIIWNEAAISVAAERHTTLSENARLFLLLNLAMADGTIASWDAKFTYVFWRPVTAIRLAATDGNDATVPDAAWTPLLATPAHPDYTSNHSTVSGAATAVLASYFGDETPITLASDTTPGVLRSYTSFSAASDEVNDARVLAGIHFRSACRDGQAAGRAIGEYVMMNLARPVHGQRRGQVSHDRPAIGISADGEIVD
ncbi:MAG TPA: vanadium-dependent haloperoxidase [Blastocatellia bacterium]|nr:vanadium-dependent haloperoxidase [Blastocatellia bacterium]